VNIRNNIYYGGGDAVAAYDDDCDDKQVNSDNFKKIIEFNWYAC